MSGFWHRIEGPLGPLTVCCTRSGALRNVWFSAEPPEGLGESLEWNKYICGPVALELAEYFSGQRRSFDLELSIEGTPFQRDIWYRLGKIPFGETLSYAELARKAGRRTAIRAVANAVALNPVPLVIPCHRIIRSDGSLGFYAARSMPREAGSSWKAWLLGHEGAVQRS